MDAAEALSREFALACDRQGVVTWCDERARRALGIEAGASLAAMAAPGTGEKMQALLARALSERTDDWEVALVIRGRPATVCFNGAPRGDGIVLVGHVAPENYLRALDQLSESMTEVMRLNREVVSARRELQSRHDELVRLHGDLRESHQGVLAMHAELADRAAELGRVVQVKSRIVADVGHELRTPLHAILVLVRLLLDGVDGPLVAEQAKQVTFIRKSAEDLLRLVDDLLDLSEAEFGKSILRVETFALEEFAASARGMLRPLVPQDSRVALVFDVPPAITLETDRTKLGQVVRNLVSNALKFTERGEVRVSFAERDDGMLHIEVADTGIGIAPADHERVFEEFAQLETPPHMHVKGTGLGLALSRRLARRLAGDITVESAAGRGASFTVAVPIQHPEAQQVRALLEAGRRPAAGPPVLVVEDDYDMLLEYGRYFAVGGLHLLPARTLDAAREAMLQRRPAAIVLDIMLDGEASWNFLAQLKSDPATRGIPVVIVTVTSHEERARALGADEFWVKPLDVRHLVARLNELAVPERVGEGAAAVPR
jgi:signal transduction histidine kinase/CheY-like chemotaxis protein